MTTTLQPLTGLQKSVLNAVEERERLGAELQASPRLDPDFPFVVESFDPGMAGLLTAPEVNPEP